MGLYDDDNAQVKDGDADSDELFEAKAVCVIFYEALQTNQPNDALLKWLPGAAEKLDAALAKYPNHEDLLHWRGQAKTLLAGGGEVDGYPTWTSDFPWRQDKFRKGWVALQYARFALTTGDKRQVYWKARNVLSNWEQCHDIDKWPEETQKLFGDGMAEAEALADEYSGSAG